ncbi:MAG: hypothetical protein KJS92_01060 [Bacteroidetes bacterium]|nr:hypothetical protein [Bacteroidota bacterium]
MFACKEEVKPPVPKPSGAYREVKTIAHNGVKVDVVIDKPEQNEVDVMLLYHGTVGEDSKILEAAQNTLDGFKRILNRKDMMLVSVAYPEENLLFGDNLAFAEAALLWLRQDAEKELGIKVGKVFLAGHSQGGYLVTRLNTMHETDGVIANGPGPLNLIYRCELEESGKIASGKVCTLLRNTYGTTTANPNAYRLRSLLNFSSGFKSDILFVQGMDDSPIQMYSWPVFKDNVLKCSNCRERKILELPGFGHQALFESVEAKDSFNAFIGRR